MVSAMQEIAAVVGLPLEVGGKLFNSAALIAGGRVLGLVPKTYLPTTNEFYEERWFTPGDLMPRAVIQIAGEEIPIGNDLLFAARDFPELVIGVEICEDLWAVNPPSGDMALAGADPLRQRFGQQRTAGQVRIPARPGAPAIGALPRGLSLHGGRFGRIHHRSGVGRSFADRGERRRSLRRRSASTSTHR